MTLDGLRAAHPGLTFRPATMDDAPAVTALFRAAELAANGEAEATEGDLREMWARPGFDLTRDSVLVLDRGHAVAHAEVYRGRAEACVDAAHQGRGIGTTLVGWWRERAGEVGFPAAGQTVSDLDPGARGLLEGLGATPTHTAWVLRYSIASAAPPPVLPVGLTLRDARSGEETAVFETIETAFSEWPDRSPTTYGDWAATAMGRADFEAWMAPVVVDPDGTLVGAALLRPYPGEGWVDQLAVARARRGQGVARALLHHAFGVFARRGEPAVGLSTDSRTGALDLYLRVGMTVRRSYTRWTFRE